VDESVELAVLPAWIDMWRQVFEEALVEGAACERGVELAGIDADEDRLEPFGDEAAGQLCGVPTPEREQPTPLRRREALLAIGAHLLEEEIAEGDCVDAIERLE
jgi:hypothetical protein